MAGQVSKGQYFAIKAALTYTEKELIDFYELEWHLRHRVPTVDDVVAHINRKHEKEGKHGRVKLTSVNYYLQRAPVMNALKKRGIPFEQHTQSDLTSTQIAAATTVMNFADTRSNDEKLDQLGIKPSQYFAWLNDPQFKNLVDSLATQNLKNIKPEALTEFSKKIHQGDWQAIKYYLDVTGAVQSDELPPAAQMLRMIIEVVQKHVKEPQVMMAIAQDLMLVTQTNRHLELTGEFTDNDMELEHAKKQLGI
jgi:hypothetical protein